VQYRSGIQCDKPVRKISMQAHLHRGTSASIGARVGSGPLQECYQCGSTATSRGPDFYYGGSGEYTVRVYLRLIAPGSSADPWIAVSGTPASSTDPASCSPNREIVECFVDLELTATPWLQMPVERR
jgi:hypothetical protein